MAQPQQWYVRFPQGLQGPFTPRQIRVMARDGQLRKDYFVSQDRGNWILAAQLAVPFAADAPAGGSAAASVRPATLTPASMQPTARPLGGPSSTAGAPVSASAARKDDATLDDSPFAPTAEFPAMRWEDLPQENPAAKSDPAGMLWNETAASPRIPAPAEADVRHSGGGDLYATMASPVAAGSLQSGGAAGTGKPAEVDPRSRTEMRSDANTQPLSGLETPPSRRPAMALDAISADIEWMLAHRDQAIPGYELEAVLGRGGMGVVFQARQTKLDRLVAIKCMLVSQVQNHTALTRFEKEAKTIARLRHLNVVQAYDFGQHDGRLYLVMELLQGEDLETVLNREQRLPEAYVWGLIRQAASGLAHATELGIVHRDVKPANLFLVQPPAGLTMPDGMRMVKVTDFGIAMLQLDSPESKRLTAENTSMGTPLYMAPEQGFGADVDCRADIYALGASTYHLIAGFPPYDGTNPLHIMMQKMKQPLPKISERFPDVSPETDALLADMQAGDVRKRIPDYQTLLARIDALPCLQGAAPLPSTLRSTVGATLRGSSVPDVSLGYDDDEPAAAPAAEPKRTFWTRRAALAVAGGAAALTFVLAGVMLFALKGGALFAPATPKAPLVLQTDFDQPLFDGESLQGWLLDRGSWKAAVDEEGGKVLRGAGVIRRPLPPFPMYRVACGADLRKTKRVEMRFALTKTGKFYALRVEEGKAQLVFGEGSKPAVPKGPAVAFSPVDPDELKYHELKVEKQGPFWWAFLDAAPIGVVPLQSDKEQDEVQFHVDGEIALEDLVQSRLVEPKAK